MYKDDKGEVKSGLVSGDIEFRRDGTCSGTRKIGTIMGPLEPTYSLSGGRLTIASEGDVHYAWEITSAQEGGKDIWLLSLNSDGINYQLMRLKNP